MTPSVRGPQKALVAGLLVASGAATGALAGFAVGVVGAVTGLGPIASPWLAALVLLAVAGDLASRPRPVCVGRQVPREWSELFAPGTVAVLYGGRLGVGPLTILPSWLWWAAVAAGATLGPGASALTGAAFGTVRLLAVLGVAEWARTAMAPRIARLRRAEPLARTAAAAVATLIAAATLVA